ncbi:DddA-like double-stranded DNA deaminase toxin [Streptomyces lonegramiae]|uniref:DddA-like double-stranded DNA deaminase toxin n=1 Tax=Streptomyces lonegramiae TaxID=3075524 RepID=UPI00374E08FC
MVTALVQLPGADLRGRQVDVLRLAHQCQHHLAFGSRQCDDRSRARSLRPRRNRVQAPVVRGTRPPGDPAGRNDARCGTGSSTSTWRRISRTSFSPRCRRPIPTASELAVDAATGETQRRRLDPFGNDRDTDSSDTSSWVDDKGFVGGTNDETSGLVNLGAREYDASTGRFISADPIVDYTDPQQINGYAYSYNNPVTFSDPDGLKPDDCIYTGVQCSLKSNGGWNVKPTKTYYTYYGVQAPKESTAGYKARQAQTKADVAKQRAFAVAKELAGIIADELGITDALDCFTTGSLGSCKDTAVNIVTSVIGGAVTKLVKKYGMPWQWNKAAALAKRLWGLGNDLLDRSADYIRLSRKAKKAAKEAGECNSFTPDTKVLMADGSTKAIKDVDIGDKVLATDPETGETKTETVTSEIKGKGLKHLVKVTIDVDGKKGSKTASVTATDGHPFWVPELGKSVEATDLKAGEWLRTSAGTRVQVGTVKRWSAQKATVYNLTVASEHTYYVLAGATPALVHNCDSLGEIADELADSKITTGQVVDDAGNRVGAPVSSGESGSFSQVRDAIRESGLPHDPAGGFAAASHVETKIALAMRSNNIKRAVAVINNPVCSGPFSCMTGVSAILPRGSSLTAVWRTEEGWHGVTMLGGR